MFLASGGKSSGGGSSGGTKSSGSGGSSWFGGEPVDPLDDAKEWKRNLQKEMRKIDRDIINIKRQEDRAMKECKALAKANRASAAKVLAKEIVRTRKTVERMYVAKAQLNSVCNSLQTSICKLHNFLISQSYYRIIEFYFAIVCYNSLSETSRMYAKKCRNHDCNE